MSRALLASAATLFLCALALAPALADDDPATATATPAPTAATPAPPSPMMAAIDDALQQEHAQVAGLAAQLAAATDDASALALQRAIEQAKMDGQLRVLGIQVQFARLEGRADDATKLEAALAAMGKVDVPADVEQRPAPNSAAGR